jgi:hypothetical protein
MRDNALLAVVVLLVIAAAVVAERMDAANDQLRRQLRDANHHGDPL